MTVACVVRGGPYRYLQNGARCAYRLPSPPDGRWSVTWVKIAFRLVRNT